MGSPRKTTWRASETLPWPRTSEAPAAGQTGPSSELVALDLGPGHAHLFVPQITSHMWVFVLFKK